MSVIGPIQFFDNWHVRCYITGATGPEQRRVPRELLVNLSRVSEARLESLCFRDKYPLLGAEE